MKTIYLAGAITGLSFNEASEWREWTTQCLDHRYKILNPLRGYECLNDWEDIGTGLKQDGLKNHQVFTRDLIDIDESDIALFNFLPGISAGTMWELGYVFSKNMNTMRITQIVIVKDKDQTHPFIKGSASRLLGVGRGCRPLIFNDLDTALDILCRWDEILERSRFSK